MTRQSSLLFQSRVWSAMAHSDVYYLQMEIGIAKKAQNLLQLPYWVSEMSFNLFFHCTSSICRWSGRFKVSVAGVFSEFEIPHALGTMQFCMGLICKRQRRICLVSFFSHAWVITLSPFADKTLSRLIVHGRKLEIDRRMKDPNLYKPFEISNRTDQNADVIKIIFILK